MKKLPRVFILAIVVGGMLLVTGFAAYILPTYSFSIRTNGGIFFTSTDSPLGGVAEPTVELLVNKADFKMLLNHGDVEMIYSNCKNKSDDTQVGFLRPNDKQSMAEVYRGVYKIEFRLNPIMTPKKWLFNNVRENIRCVYVKVPRINLGKTYVSNTVKLPNI